MKQAKIVLAAMLLTGLSSHTLADEAEYDIASEILTIPSVKIGEDHVYDATLKLNDEGSFDVVGFSDKPTASGGSVDAECTPEHITLDTFNQLTTGMSVEQVNSLIGCKGELNSAGSSLSDYWWVGGGTLLKPLISVKFSDKGSFSQTYLPSR